MSPAELVDAAVWLQEDARHLYTCAHHYRRRQDALDCAETLLRVPSDSPGCERLHAAIAKANGGAA